MAYSKGRLIIIEGGDGAGKATQTALLLKALKKHGPTTFFEFPRYKQSQFGKLIRRSLDGEFGDFLTLSPYLSSLPYILDRARAKYLIQEALKEGDVVCDRYTPSNLAHQGAKLSDKERQKFVNFIEEGEYKELGLPVPDLVMYLWVPAEVSKKLLLKRGRKTKRTLDTYESELDYQIKVVNTYLSLAKSHKNWRVVKCVDEAGKLLSRNQIHELVLQIVRKRLKMKI
jgi:dTMP kinase